MQEFIIKMMDQFGYLGIALLIAIENLFPPIPSEIILTFGGFMTTQSSMTIPGVVLCATVGAVVGALILYAVGRILAPERLEKLLSGKLGRALGFKQGDLLKAANWFNRKGSITVFFCRCIPIVRSLISIPAGMANMKMLPFLLMTTRGTLIWNIVLVALRAAPSHAWEHIADSVDAYAHIIPIALIVIAGGVLIYYCGWWRKRRLREQDAQGQGKLDEKA